MKPTIEYIQTRFDEYNERFFGGSLPHVPVKLSHAKGFLGKVTYTRRKQGLFRGYRNEDFVLRINVRIDLPEPIIEDTILHEMIHYYIAVNQWTDTSTHGQLFRREMARINREGHRHITISHRLSASEQSQAVLTKGRVVAVVHFADGKTGIKVVPKQIKHILAWHRQALTVAKFNSEITHISWYYTDDEYFSKYPSSMALRIYLIDTPHSLPLANAHRLIIGESNVRLDINPDNNLRW
ncbi:MAG: SprT-like domain-containing protein [Paludibacteraceae bacterium]|nr:SprT-like domain-containing protein [Paludibacteraceae bacterium]